MSHYLKILLDIIFGEKNFRNEISWLRKQGEKHNLARLKMTSSHDIIFWYAKSNNTYYNIQYLAYSEEYINKNYKYKDEKGLFATFPCTNASGGNKIYDFRGIKRPWRFSAEKMESMYQDKLLTQATPDSPFRYKKYLEKNKGVKLGDLWEDIAQPRGKENKKYPTQKPLKLLERIIKASSNEGDFILDPFCGCATTCVAAEKLGRKWAGIDVSVMAYDLVRERIKEELDGTFDFTKKNNPREAIEKNYSTTAPKRTDGDADVQIQKYVYVISNPAFQNMYKVGIAKNYTSRLNSYQTSDPDRNYKLEYKILTPNFRPLEKYIHEKFNNKHEWVRGDLNEIIKEIENFDTDKN